MSRRSTCAFFRCLFMLLLGVHSAQAGTAATIRQFQTQGGALEITAGSDGNLWFTQSIYAGRLTVSGEHTRFEVPVPFPEHAFVVGITEGPDGALWMTDCGRAAIHRMTKTGVFTYFPLSQDDACPEGITLGPDGALWFTEANAFKVGRITPAGALTEFPLPIEGPRDITTGPDGNLWIIGLGRIGRLTLEGHSITFPLEPGANGRNIAAGADGGLWFTRGIAIGRISTEGAMTEYKFPPFPQPGVNGIVSGPDGNIWYTDGLRDLIGRITPAGAITEFALPPGSTPRNLNVGPDGNFWIASSDPDILRFTPGGTPGDTCVPSDTVLCIDDEPGDRRFKIEVQYETAQAGGLAGNGHAVPLASAGLGRGGVFWFFSEDNPEVFIKVLDGCGLNQKHWVFLSAGTNVGYIVTVQDLVSGVVRSYYNVDQKPAPVVQDTNAFPCAGSAP